MSSRDSAGGEAGHRAGDAPMGLLDVLAFLIAAYQIVIPLALLFIGGIVGLYLLLTLLAH